MTRAPHQPTTERTSAGPAGGSCLTVPHSTPGHQCWEGPGEPPPLTRRSRRANAPLAGDTLTHNDPQPANPPRRSASGYRFTPEDHAKAAQARRETAAKRAAAKERAKLGLSAQIAHELETRAHEIVQAYLAAGLERGDWRALDALADRHLGRPTQRVETHATAADALSELSPERLDELARQALQALEQATITEAERAASTGKPGTTSPAEALERARETEP